MAYRIEPHEPSSAGLRRVAAEELDEALELLGSSDQPLDRRVHEARKHLKKLRALFALARGAADEDELDAQARNVRRAARALARLRGQAALVESFRALNEAFPGELAPEAVARIEAALAPDAGGETTAGSELRAASELLSRTRADLEATKFRGSGWGALELGFRRTYRRARKAYARAFERVHPEALHSFRTPAKRHLYQIQLLEALWPELLHAHKKELSRLGDLLGDHHDLSLLGPELEQRGLSAEERAPVEKLLERRSHELEGQVFDLGGRLFAERPRAVARRFRKYFAKTWNHAPR